MKKRFIATRHDVTVIPLEVVNVAECLTSPHAIWAMLKLKIDTYKYHIHEGKSHIAVIDRRKSVPVLRLLLIEQQQQKGGGQ